MKTIIALGGSNSKKSINKAFATYVANQIADVQVVVADLNDFKLPLFGVDEESENGIPEDAKKLNSLLESANGLVISLAEHNGSYSAAFKNAFDWVSRIDKKIWKNKPMLLMATSPGARGGTSVLEGAKKSFPHMGGNIIASFSLPLFNDNYTIEGLKDEQLNDTLNEKIKLFQEAI